MISNKSIRPIGGVFALPNLGSLKTTSLGPHAHISVHKTILLANARSCLYLIVQQLQPKTVWLPSFLCSTMIEPIRALKVAWRFYPVTGHLEVQDQEWVGELHEQDLVVVIDYFGFPASESLKARVKSCGARIVEDASQALLTPGIGRGSDFLLLSPRKFLGIPDGGLLLCMDREAAGSIPELQLSSPDQGPWLKALAACMLRQHSDLFGAHADWFRLFQESEAKAPCGLFSMSDLSRSLLSCAFDYDEIGQRRRSNYLRLLDHLGPLAVLAPLPAGVVPSGFPIRLENRDLVRSRLFEQQVFPPVHWPISGAVPETFTESHKLASSIMTLVCDQRYGSAEMDLTSEILKSAIVLKV